MSADLKHVRVRRCATCGETHDVDGVISHCRVCGGPLVTLGPISWTEEDEAFEALEQAAVDLDILEDPEDEFQDIICELWDEIEALEDEVDDRDVDIEELGDAIIEHVKDLEQAKAKLEDESLKGKVKKAFGTE